MRRLPCGCRTCGCLCAEHAGDDRNPSPCWRHRPAGLVLEIVALSLFLGMIAVWAAIIC